MTEKQIAENIIKCVDIVRQGCTNAGPPVVSLGLPSDPLECEACVTGFLNAVTNLLNNKEN